MPFENKKVVEFEPKFDVDLVKLEPKKVPKVSRAERRKRQKEREAELNGLLLLKQSGQLDEETLLKAASEGGEIGMAEVSAKDKRRLARLKAKAEKGVVTRVVAEGAIN